MNRGCFQDSFVSIAERSFNSNCLSKPVTEIQLDVVCRDIHQFAPGEGTVEMLHHAEIDLVRLLCSDGRLGIILQKEIRPLLETQAFSFPNHIQDVVVSGLQPFPQKRLGCLPVFREGRFGPTYTVSVAIPNPPEWCVLSPVNHTIVLSRSRHPA